MDFEKNVARHASAYSDFIRASNLYVLVHSEQRRGDNSQRFVGKGGLSVRFCQGLTRTLNCLPNVVGVVSVLTTVVSTSAVVGIVPSKKLYAQQH